MCQSRKTSGLGNSGIEDVKSLNTSVSTLASCDADVLEKFCFITYFFNHLTIKSKFAECL